MRRFFVKNILFIITINVLVKTIYVFFIDRNVQNDVVGGDYGTFQALFNLSIIFQTILDFGISNYNSRTIAQNPDKLQSLFPEMLSARLVLMIIYMLIAYAFGYVLGYRGWELSLLLGVLLFQSLNALVSFIRSNIAALQRFKTDGLLSITDRMLMILICGPLLLYPPTAKQFKIEWFVFALIICYFISAVVSFLILKRIGKINLRFSFDPPVIFKIVRQSFPYALLIFLMSIYNRADAMMIERLCTDGGNQTTVWAAAFRLLDMANIFGLMFATMLLPFFGRMLSQKNDVQPIVKVCVNMMLPFSFMIAIAGIFFSSDIMHLLYHKSVLYKTMSLDYDIVFAWLIASFPAWCLMYVYSTLLTANGSMKTLNIIAFAGVVINLSLNFYLIPGQKVIGAAITSFITQTSLGIIFMVYAARIVKLPLNIKWALSLIGYLLLILLLAYGIIIVLRNIHWLVQLSAFGAISIVLMFVFRFISVQGIKQLLNKSGT